MRQHYTTFFPCAQFEITAAQRAGLGAVLQHPIGVGRAVVVVGVPVARPALVHAVAAAAAASVAERLEAEAVLPVDISGEVADAAVGPLVGVVAQMGPVLVVHVPPTLPSVEHPRFSCGTFVVKVMEHPKVVPDFVGNSL